jgi:histidyl-tRNA synthetase
MIKAVRGMRDLFGPEMHAWHRAEDAFRVVSAAYGYEEIRTPVLEHTEVFARGIGQETDIVGKEMYTFEDRNGDSLTLRPEMTAPIVRTAIENNMVRHSPVTRLWYTCQLFRHERPQKGRYRQFHQYGAECLGSPHPEADVEVIALAKDVIDRIGVKSWTLEINSIGTAESRAAYRDALVEYFSRYEDRLSEDSRRRLRTNPLRILDSKDEQDRALIADAPRIASSLDAASTEHFAMVRSMLDNQGIAYTVNPLMVRGLDYYSHTVFEFTTDRLGSQNAIGGGGRYDPLFAMLGGGAVPAVGFSLGIERLMLLLEEEQGGWGEAPRVDVYLAPLSDAARVAMQSVAVACRAAGLTVVTDLLRRSVKSQFKEANRVNARTVVLIGDDELAAGTAQVKDLSCGTQVTVPVAEVVRAINETV